MASPQVENGFLQLSIEVLESVYRLKINIDAMRIVLFIIRKTYGWKKKRDKISLSQFESSLEMSRSNICRNLNKLTSMKIIIKIQDDNGSIYEFNKDYDEWEVVAKQPRRQIDNEVVAKQTMTPVAKQRHTIDTITKETIQKTNEPKGSNDIQKIMNLFYEMNPSLNFGKKPERDACSSLIKKFGLEESLRMVQLTISIQGEPYAPVVTTPSEMWNKFAKIAIFIKGHKLDNQVRKA